MTTLPRITAALALAACLLLGACESGLGPAAPSSAPSAGPSQDAGDLPTSDPGGGPVGGGAGGGTSGNAGGGVVQPAPPGGGTDPTGGGAARLVRPQPGQRDPHPVAPIKLESSVDGHHVLVKVSWYSGIEPCSVLDSVRVERVGSEIRVTPLEGIGDPTAVCIDIAELKATIVDLGDVDAGTWQITAPGGDATPIELTIG